MSDSDYVRLRAAVRAIYYAGVWHCDRPVDEKKLWTELRDAAGFELGQSPNPITTTTLSEGAA